MSLSVQVSDPSREPNILLLNPPAPQPVLRDNYCGFAAKASYLWPPIDLLVQSGWLGRHGKVTVIDAIAEGLSEQRCAGRVLGRRPDLVVMLSSGATFEDDALFVKHLSQKLPHTRFVASLGPMVCTGPQYLELYPWMHGVLSDYSSPAVAQALAGEAHEAALYTRHELDSGIRPRPVKARKLTYPIPQHCLFPLERYSIPLGWQGTFSTVLTSFGCAHRCSFCSGGATRYRRRPTEDVIEELEYLRALDVSNLFFIDYTLTTHKKGLLRLCREMVRRDLNFRWTSFGRVDHIDREVLRAMKRAGCDLLQLGVESGDDRILRRYNKEFTVAQVRRAFRLCHEEGVRTLAFFIIGLPGETAETVESTIQLALDLEPDLASFAMPTPDPGTSLRDEAVQRGMMAEEPMQVLSTVGPTVGTEELTADEIRTLRSQAVRRFYLRPSFLLRQIRQLRSWTDVKEKAQNALSLLSRS